jgi:hypothetical protein
VALAADGMAAECYGLYIGTGTGCCTHISRYRMPDIVLTEQNAIRIIQ